MAVSNVGVLLACAVSIEAGLLAIGALGDLSLRVPEYLLFYLLTCCAYMAAAWAACRSGRSPMSLIWTAGVVFRLTLLPLSPNLSDDLARYRWQGQVQAAGGNPYVAAPADAEWAGLRDSTWPQVTRKDLPSSYGPLLELTHSGTYRLASLLSGDPERQAWLFKLPFALLELGVGGAVWLLLRLNGLPPQRLLLYLWSPLVLVEFWAQGHNDSLAMLLAVVALAAARAARPAAAWATLTAAALAKLWPLILAPLLLFQRQENRLRLRWRSLWAAFPIAALAVRPYADGIWAAGGVLEGFAGGWRNNDSLYGWIFAWTGRDADAASRWAALALAAALVWIWRTQRRRESAALWSIVALLLLAPNCFPWYLCWFAPLLTLYPHPALLLWTALSGLSYHVLTDYAVLGVWEEAAFHGRLQYWPVLALLLLGRVGTGIPDRPWSFRSRRRGLD